MVASFSGKEGDILGGTIRLRANVQLFLAIEKSTSYWLAKSAATWVFRSLSPGT